MCCCYGEQFGDSSKVKHRITIWLTVLLLVKYTKESKSGNAKKYMHHDIHSSIIYYRHKVSITQVPLTYSGILYSHKKKSSSHACYNMDKPWKKYAELNKPDIKGK